MRVSLSPVQLQWFLCIRYMVITPWFSHHFTREQCFRRISAFKRGYFFLKIMNSLKWIDGLRFNVLFNSISVISGRQFGDNERLCAMDLVYGWKEFRLKRARTRERLISRPAFRLLNYQDSSISLRGEFFPLTVHPHEEGELRPF